MKMKLFASLNLVGMLGAGALISACSVTALPTLTTSPIDGNWSEDSPACILAAGGSCTGAPASGSGPSFLDAQALTYTLALGNGLFTYTMTGYSDCYCTTPSLTFVQGGTFSVGGTDATVTTALDATFTQASLVATPLTSPEATTLSAFCSSLTFTANTPMSVSGASCSSLTLESNGQDSPPSFK